METSRKSSSSNKKGVIVYKGEEKEEHENRNVQLFDILVDQMLTLAGEKKLVDITQETKKTPLRNFRQGFVPMTEVSFTNHRQKIYNIEFVTANETMLRSELADDFGEDDSIFFIASFLSGNGVESKRYFMINALGWEKQLSVNASYKFQCKVCGNWHWKENCLTKKSKKCIENCMQ